MKKLVFSSLGGFEVFYCRNCFEIFRGAPKGQCPECKRTNLLDIETFFESIIERLKNSWVQMLSAFNEVSSLARKGEEVTREYILLRKKGLNGRETIRSKILNFYASLSLVDTISSAAQEIRQEFKQFQGKATSSLPPSAIIEKVSKFESRLLEKVDSLKERLKGQVSSLTSPKKSISPHIQRLGMKVPLLRLFKVHRNLQKGERVIEITCNRERRRILYITSQRLLVISSLKNEVIKELSLSKISSVELKGRIFTKKIVLRLSNHKEVDLQFHPGRLSEIRESIKRGRKAEGNTTFTLEKNMYKPDVRELQHTLVTLFKSIVKWLKRKRALVNSKGSEKELTEKQALQGEAKQDKKKEREILKRTLSALEDSFKKGLVKPDYFFDKKADIEQDLNNLEER